MDALDIVNGIATVTVSPPEDVDIDDAGVNASSSSDSDSDVDYSLPTIPIRSLDDAAPPAVPLETSPAAPQVTIRRNSHCPKLVEDYSKTGKRYHSLLV